MAQLEIELNGDVVLGSVPLSARRYVDSNTWGRTVKGASAGSAVTRDRPHLQNMKKCYRIFMKTISMFVTDAEYDALCLIFNPARVRVRKQRTVTPSYAVAHIRVRDTRGPAKDHACEHCKSVPALHWAYDHADPAEMSESGRLYSMDPEHYLALCRACHQVFDRPRNRAKQLARLTG